MEQNKKRVGILTFAKGDNYGAVLQAYIKLEVPYRLNQKDWKPQFIPLAKARKRIETTFSQLTDQFMMMRNYAKQCEGLFARVIGKISAFTFLQYINHINNRPIGRVKYALI